MLLHAVDSSLYDGGDGAAVGLCVSAALLVEAVAAAVEVVDEVFALGLVEAVAVETGLDSARARIARVGVLRCVRRHCVVDEKKQRDRTRRCGGSVGAGEGATSRNSLSALFSYDTLRRPSVGAAQQSSRFFQLSLQPVKLRASPLSRLVRLPSCHILITGSHPAHPSQL